MTLNFVKRSKHPVTFLVGEESSRRWIAPRYGVVIHADPGVRDLLWSPSRIPFPKIRLFWWLP